MPPRIGALVFGLLLRSVLCLQRDREHAERDLLAPNGRLSADALSESCEMLARQGTSETRSRRLSELGFPDSYGALLSKVACSHLSSPRTSSGSVGPRLRAALQQEEQLDRGVLFSSHGDLAIVEHQELLQSGRFGAVDASLRARGLLPTAILANHSVYAVRPDAATAKAGAAVPTSTTAVPDLNICMTTIPRRLMSDGFNATLLALESLLTGQDYKASTVHAFLSVPQAASVREGLAYPVERAAALAAHFPGQLTIVPLDHDLGPLSRYIGCKKVVTDPNALILAFDDDHAYKSYALSTLVCAKQALPKASFSGYSYPWKSHPVGQGSDGLIMRRSDLDGIESEGLSKAAAQHCFRVDDLLVSRFLEKKNRGVKSIPIGTCPHLSPMYMEAHSNDMGVDGLYHSGYDRGRDMNNCSKCLDLVFKGAGGC